MRRCHLGRVQWNQADQHSQSEALKKSNRDEHADGNRASHQGGADEGKRASNSEGLFAAQPIGSPALDDGANG